MFAAGMADSKCSCCFFFFFCFFFLQCRIVWVSCVCKFLQFDLLIRFVICSARSDWDLYYLQVLALRKKVSSTPRPCVCVCVCVCACVRACVSIVLRRRFSQT